MLMPQGHPETLDLKQGLQHMEMRVLCSSQRAIPSNMQALVIL
jgi:hypothetical protein